MKMLNLTPITHRIIIIGLVGGLLGGCNVMDRVNDIGSPPPVSKIENPVSEPGYQPVSLPMPRPQPPVHAANSLWRTGARAFFKDQRASEIGDILTVNINIDDKAAIANTTSRSRNNSEGANASSVFGLEQIASKVFNEIDPTNLASIGSNSSSTGAGSVDRSEEISLTVAAIVTQVLPNGNLVISGSQEVLVNYEKRMMRITGVVRPADISSTNTIAHTQIAEARIAYGGRGQITDVQQPRYGQQLFDVIFPF